MSVIDEIIEDMEKDKEIVKSFVPKDSLPNDIFDKKNDTFILKEDIRDKLLQISNEFIEFIGVDFFIYDIILTGSLSNFNWSKYSDVDLHILVDYNEFDNDGTNLIAYHEIMKEFFDAKKQLWNKSTDIKIKNYEVELYIQGVDEKHLSTGVYSILNNEWVVQPKKLESAFDLDDRKILSKAEEYTKQIDQLVDYSENGEDVSDDVINLKDKIKKFRQSGLDNGGEYSYENLTFKLLRRNGYIEKLMDIKTSIRNKKLSLPQ